MALITPVHSFNLLVRLLPEQKAWRHFARLRNLSQLPDVRMMNAFGEEVGVRGLRQVNSHLLDPLIENLDSARPALALIDATDLPAACSGFKKTRAGIPPPVPLWGDARSRVDKASALDPLTIRPPTMRLS